MEHTSNVADLVVGVVVLLLIAAIVLTVTKRIRLPFTVMLVIVGVVIARLGSEYEGVFGPLVDHKIFPDLIIFVFLPTLIFESAYNLDVRQLRHNLGAVLMLAVPGFLISTLLIGLIVGLAAGIPLKLALLLGAILSATDPVAVIALFKELGAPQRLTILVEGESLFNDATAMVVSRVLLVIAASTISPNIVADGVLDFFILFGGGLLVGWGLGLLTGFALGLLESESFAEITLTTILAYLSFLLAEHVLHVSGIMATLGAGLTLGGWGRMKVSPSVRSYLDNFWEYMAFIANALIFLLMGLRLA